MIRAQWWVGTIVLALGMWYLIASDTSNAADDKDAGAVPVTEAEFKKLVARSVGDIQKALAGKDKNGPLKARTGALLIAAYAQHTQGGPSAAERATLRDAALRLFDTIKAGKNDDAKKQAEALVDLKADPKSKTEPVPILKQAKDEIKDVMRQMAPPASGGSGYEGRLKKLAGIKVKLPDAELNEDFMLMSYQMAAMGALIKDNPPGKNPKEFQKLADDLRDLTIRLADLGKKQDGVMAAQTLYKLTIHCNRCHDKYRE